MGVMIMKKPIQSIVVLTLSLVMVFGMLPSHAHAFDDIAVNEENFPNAAFRGHVSAQFDIDRNEILTED